MFFILKQEVVDLNESSESEDREKNGEMFRCQNYRAFKKCIFNWIIIALQAVGWFLLYRR